MAALLGFALGGRAFLAMSAAGRGTVVEVHTGVGTFNGYVIEGSVGAEICAAGIWESSSGD